MYFPKCQRFICLSVILLSCINSTDAKILQSIWETHFFYDIHLEQQKGQLLIMNIQNMFSEKPLVKVCAPMVRYSKLEFRTLVRKYDCDLCFTPMIMADSFIKSEKARKNEFTTSVTDKPLIVQFAANNSNDFLEATQLVCQYSDGVDLNCGCPQRWAVKLGIGSSLLSEPETIKGMVLNVKNQVNSDYSVSVKLRLLNCVRTSVELCRKLEKAGVTFLTIHGRTKEQKSEPINVDALKEIASSVQIPVILNGDVKTLEDAIELQNKTKCQGVMSARGILHNPALFKGYSSTPVKCIEDWVQIALDSNLYFKTFHHHLIFMLSKILPKTYKRKVNCMTNYPDVISFLNQYYNFNFNYKKISNTGNEEDCPDLSSGKYFTEVITCD